MKITGYRSLTAFHDWQRPVGDVNGIVESGITEVPVLLLETDGGLTGIGLGLHREIDRLFPAVEGADPRGVATLYDAMLSHVFKSGHAGATFGTIAAVDMALWDLKAKMAEEPLWRTLGAGDRFVSGYASGLCYGLDDAAFAAHYGQWAERGFTAAKIKGGRDLDRDIARLETAREILSRNTSRPALMLDVNEAWNTKQAIRHLAEIAKHVDLTWIEEPVRRWDSAGHARIARAAKTAVATGENLTGLEQYAPLFDAGAVDIVQAGSVWGITHFLRVAMAAHSRGLPVSPVAYNANPVAHAAAAVPNMIGIEVQDFAFPAGFDVDQQIAEGGIVLGDRPGLGIEIDEAAVASAVAAIGWGERGGPHRRPADAGLRLVPEMRRAAE
ncbi:MULTISPECIES: mandelate racemase/muconate lactonizing enzyme family protein [Novosphingobium]|jgi:L-alanine-DL-glutamate epimerase-like enolase superfamily enzyme|uniref:mandelate racemase/muconate lactonizing enzyme family protein n=1 Tax=Novosphingobium TaxID=165696 RepID=UPI0022F258A7|nr:mandelate racemase/muconate lactonizing enzyme family protein [Novosphingobium resinovorum]GLK44862.1 racemase [Novosphingobium resinovorum]